VADRIRPEVADGAPIEGDLVAVIDESSPQNTAGGVTYVVAIAALFDPHRALASLGALFTADRRRRFHWEREGTIARTRIIEIAAEIGVVATAHYAHVGRRGQSRARQGMLAEMVRDAAADGVDHLVIEASDAATVGRDRVTLLRTFEGTGGVPFRYDWRSKSERVLWLADAIAGAAGEHLVGKDDTWWQLLHDLGVVSLRSHP
jgi:aspartate oxidase